MEMENTQSERREILEMCEEPSCVQGEDLLLLGNPDAITLFVEAETT